MAKNDFLLPDELGWECNDKISKYIDEWVKNLTKHQSTPWVWPVAKAELMDNVYAIIKEYQK